MVGGLSRKTPMPKATKPMKRTPLPAREMPLAPSPLAKVSKKAKKRRKSYQSKLKLDGQRCHFCWNPAQERHHIYETGQFSFMATVALNLIPVCRSCHGHIHATGTERCRETMRATEPERMAVLDDLAANGGKANQIRKLGRAD